MKKDESEVTSSRSKYYSLWDLRQAFSPPWTLVSLSAHWDRLVCLMSTANPNYVQQSTRIEAFSTTWAFGSRFFTSGLPGGAVDLLANAGDTGPVPGPGRFYTPRSNQSRTPRLLTLSSAAESCSYWSLRLRACAPKTKPSTAVRSPHATTGGSLRTATKPRHKPKQII